ncbi:EAL domain-containing protein [Limibaculum sp. M0105]|uniref:EAL domain-containing protein n=1 Tax=Thermohalobaculum xanthum TaxID=2753746 RepID=A0A8J7M5R1_9RHOB|nr:EAL domain-containing protein [Thermohalobaculum xanthum]MBK0398710.1 EAL domain-containing protein [Thermohalobaculum xanthum]
MLGAFACGAIIPVFQPQVSLRGGALLGLEALARWRLPSGELAGPAGFFGAATRLGLIGLIDETILAGALGQLRSWRRAGLVVARVSVNLSAAALRDPGYPDLLSFHLDMHDLAPTDLAVEIVESVLIEDDEDVAIRNVRAMARAGIAVELDDFGSGHTSVTNLLRLDLQAIKLDRALVRRMGEDGRGEAVIRAVTTMTAELGLGTIAEGAESAVDVARLAALGCDAVQGYAIARPMTGEEAALWLAAGQDGSRLAEAGVRA